MILIFNLIFFFFPLQYSFSLWCFACVFPVASVTWEHHAFYILCEMSPRVRLPPNLFSPDATLQEIHNISPSMCQCDQGMCRGLICLLEPRTVKALISYSSSFFISSLSSIFATSQPSSIWTFQHPRWPSTTVTQSRIFVTSNQQKHPQDTAWQNHDWEEHLGKNKWILGPGSTALIPNYVKIKRIFFSF